MNWIIFKKILKQFFKFSKCFVSTVVFKKQVSFIIILTTVMLAKRYGKGKRGKLSEKALRAVSHEVLSIAISLVLLCVLLIAIFLNCVHFSFHFLPPSQSLIHLVANFLLLLASASQHA